jgi:hypothetical protein
MLAVMVLAAAHLPAVCALLLVLGSPASEHELWIGQDAEGTHVTLHHRSCQTGSHHHTGLEGLLLKSEEESQRDHEFAFGSDCAATKPSLENEDGVAESPNVVSEFVLIDKIPFRPAFSGKAITALAAIQLQIPAVVRRGIVMRR